jgi:hypothetical protein
MTRTALAGSQERAVDVGGRTLMPGMLACQFHST